MNAIKEDAISIVLLEDDAGLAELIVERLQQEGFSVAHRVDGREGCALILASQPDLVLLDLMLPGMDGFEVCRTIRSAYKGPVLILTARTDDLDQILGLELGADDFVVKPVKPRVLLARIRALLRRVHSAGESSGVSRVEIGGLQVDAARRETHKQGQQIELTTIEFDLLWYMAQRAGEAISRQDLYRAIFNYDYDGIDRSIDVYISRLRQKLGDEPAAPHYIKTVRGIGYLLAGGGS